jgi:formate hydrogenlyase subunit 6/NADH:ubiquinone oxidoreductase subunit I
MYSHNLPQINLNLCNGCGACVSGCPEEALVMKSSGPAFKQPVKCTYCTDCEQLCPTGAIRTPLIFRWAVDP